MVLGTTIFIVVLYILCKMGVYTQQMTWSPLMYHTCISDELLFTWDLHEGSHYIAQLCITSAEEEVLLFRDGPIVKIHLLSNRFGELWLCPTARRVLSMFRTCRLHVRETRTEVDKKRLVFFSRPVAVFVLFLWISMEMLRIEIVCCRWEWSPGHLIALLNKPGRRLWCLCSRVYPLIY